MKSNTKLYRYMSLTEFVHILTNKKLTLKYPGNWEDKLEALFLKTVASDKGCQKLFDAYKFLHPTASDDDIKTQLQVITSKLLEVRCQCWTRNKDDLRMWQDRRSYDVVCISVDEDAFLNNNIAFHDVIYKKEICIEDILNEFDSTDNWLMQLIMIKKECFSYENECRIYQSPNSSNVVGAFGYGKTPEEKVLINFLYAKNQIGTQPICIPFSPLDIETVRTHPSASSEFEDVVKNLCEKYISVDKYIGRSKILD